MTDEASEWSVCLVFWLSRVIDSTLPTEVERVRLGRVWT